MKDVIRLLPDHIANQIAAGEVVQRPASVVKELIENSIDAGATKIELYIKDAGRTLIHSVDNGKGMSLLDSRMCFERHATSKIAHADDLFALKTKGFRGEALASISAIAHVTLKTRRADDELGYLTQMEGSKISKQEPVQCAVGTSFEIKNLFFNVPARRNFLKSDNVEFRHIIDEFERVALPHPEITFRLVHNDIEIYHLLAAPLRKRIVDIVGKSLGDKLVPVTESTDIVTIEGFVVKPEGAKKSRGDQFFFVNDRFFRDSSLNHAVSSAFEQLLPSKMHAGYFLFLTINPAEIDVNVHPTKTEIKFENDKAIYSILRTAIRSSLGKFNISPTLDFERESAFDIPFSMQFETPVEPKIQVDKTYNPFDAKNTFSGASSVARSDKSFTPAIQKTGFGAEQDNGGWEQFWNPEVETNQQQAQHAEQAELDLDSPPPVGPFLIKGSFLVASSAEGIVLIYYRRAHERMLYEEMMRGFFAQPLGSQQLIFPLEKNFSKQDELIWKENEKTLNRIGFDWEINDGTLALKGIPAILSETTVLSCVDKILEKLQMGEIDKGEVAHMVMAQLAFAGSMNFKLNEERVALEDFVNRLYHLDEHVYSPSGKRIISLISNEQLIQLF